VNEQDSKLTQAHQEDAQKTELRKALDRIAKSGPTDVADPDQYAKTIN